MKISFLRQNRPWIVFVCFSEGYTVPRCPLFFDDEQFLYKLVGWYGTLLAKRLRNIVRNDDPLLYRKKCIIIRVRRQNVQVPQ